MEKFGTGSIFNSYGLSSLADFTPISLASRFGFLFFHYYLNEREEEWQEKDFHIKSLSEIGQFLLKAPLPWMRKANAYNAYIDIFSAMYSDRLQLQEFKIDSDALFGALVILFVEAEYRNMNRMELWATKASRHSFTLFVDNIFLARFRQIFPNELEAQMKEFSFSAIQKEFIWQWLRGEIHLVRRRKSQKSN